MLTQERLKALLNYNPVTGLFTWKVSRASNKIKAGSLAGTVNKVHGYTQISIDNRAHLAHRLVWLYVYGSFPTGAQPFIDHINMNRSDNRFCNLRGASKSENQRNTVTPKNNKLGIKGVRIVRSGKFQARIQNPLTGKTEYLGLYNTKEEAIAARDEKSQEYDGEFYRKNV